MIAQIILIKKLNIYFSFLKVNIVINIRCCFVIFFALLLKNCCKNIILIIELVPKCLGFTNSSHNSDSTY